MAILNNYSCNPKWRSKCPRNFRPPLWILSIKENILNLYSDIYLYAFLTFRSSVVKGFGISISPKLSKTFTLRRIHHVTRTTLAPTHLFEDNFFDSYFSLDLRSMSRVRMEGKKCPLSFVFLYQVLARPNSAVV